MESSVCGDTLSLRNMTCVGRGAQPFSVFYIACFLQEYYSNFFKSTKGDVHLDCYTPRDKIMKLCRSA